MIDHLLKAPDEPTLIAAIGSYKNLHHVANPADGTLAGWRSDICICPTVTDNTDPNNPVVLTDFHLWVALPAPRGSPAGVEAEVHRIAGEIALMSPEPDEAKAETCFQRALAVARAQQAKSWELRACMSIARLWRDQGARVHELEIPWRTRARSLILKEL